MRLSKLYIGNFRKLKGCRIEMEREGKETSKERTMRLLYVTCTRAKESLALIAYTQSPDAVYDFCIQKGWFDDGEIIRWPREEQ